MRLDGNDVPKYRLFRYLGSMFQENGMINEDVMHCIKVGWLKWSSATGVLCDRSVM